MTLALDTLDPTVAGILYLIAVVLFIVAGLALAAGRAARFNLIAFGLAFATFVFMWNSFAAA